MIGVKTDVMAKQTYGILDGYRGTVGPVIGYQWRGRWCLRARPRRVSNPRTEMQQAHRFLFRDMVQLASRMLPVLRLGLRAASMEEQMTEGNLFVKMNKDCFSAEGVDYKSLAVSYGPVAPVEFTEVTLDDQGVLNARFEKNPLHMRASGDDEVFLYAYCPALQQGVFAAPVYRRSKRLQTTLPDEWAGLEVHLYAFIRDYDGRTSQTLYVMPDTPQQELDEDVTESVNRHIEPAADAAMAEGGNSTVEAQPPKQKTQEPVLSHHGDGHT